MRSTVELIRLATALGGLPVVACLEGSAAWEAGVRNGDVLLAIDGKAIVTWHDYVEARRRTEGLYVATIFRQGVEIELTISPTQSEASVTHLLDQLAALPEPTEVLADPWDPEEPDPSLRN